MKIKASVCPKCLNEKVICSCEKKVFDGDDARIKALELGLGAKELEIRALRHANAEMQKTYEVLRDQITTATNALQRIARTRTRSPLITEYRKIAREALSQISFIRGPL